MFRHLLTRNILCKSMHAFFNNLRRIKFHRNPSCRFSRWRISAILNFRGPVMDSSRSQAHVRLPIGRSSTETIPLNCLLFSENRFFCILATDRQTNGQTDGHHRCVKPQSRYRELRLNNVVLKVSSTSVQLCNIMKIK